MKKITLMGAYLGALMPKIKTFERESAGVEQPIKEEKKTGYVGSTRLKPNMKLFAIHRDTLEIEEVVFKKNLQNGHLEVHKSKEFAYIPAINKQNALKKYIKLHKNI